MTDDRRSDWQLIDDALHAVEVHRSDDPEPPDRRARLVGLGCGCLSALLMVGGVVLAVAFGLGWRP